MEDSTFQGLHLDVGSAGSGRQTLAHPCSIPVCPPEEETLSQAPGPLVPTPHPAQGRQRSPQLLSVSIFGGLGSSGAQRHAEGSALISLNNLSLNWGSEGLRAGESLSTLPARVCGGDSSSPEPVGALLCLTG